MSAPREKSLARSKPLLEETFAALTGCRYFQTMSPDVLRDVLKGGTLLSVPAGTVLIRKGELDEDFYILLDGALEVLADGKLILQLSNPGDIIGELAVISSSPRSADVRTASPSRLVRISSSVMKSNPPDPQRTQQLLTAFSHIMAAKLTETSRRASLYEGAVLEAQEMASSQDRLESEIRDKLQEIALYSKVVESSHDAVVITDTGGEIQRFNPAAARMFAPLKPRRRPKGIGVLDLVKGFDLGDYSTKAADQGWNGEWARGVDEELYVLQVTVTPIFAADRKTRLGRAYHFRDVSLQKAQERAITLKNEEIQKALLELEATYTELQRSDRLKMESLTVISNELAAPIRKIANHASKLTEMLEPAADGQVMAHLGAVHDLAGFLRAISDNINYLIDLQLDFQTGNEEFFDLGALAREVVAALQAKAGRRHVTFEVSMPGAPLRMSGVAEQFKIILNLILEQVTRVAQDRTPVRVKGSVLERSQQVGLEISYQGPSLVGLRPVDDRQGPLGLLIGLPLSRKVISQHQGSLQFLEHQERSLISILLPRTQREGEDRPNRVMIFDETEMDRLIVRGVIEHLWTGSVLLETSDPFELLDNYEEFKPDLVVVDPLVSEPGWNNHRVVAALIQERRHACPVLALSTLYEDFAERTLAAERGVSDFLAKPYSIFDLRFKVRTLLQTHRKEESLHKNMDQVQRQAFTDGLTKLANRKHFDGFLETQIEYSRQTHKPCSLILFDIDNFKHYNDTNGHQKGDAVLQIVGQLLARSVRASDLAARYGGEEFVVVLPETRKDMAVVIAEKIRRAFLETDFPHGETQPLGFVSASFGVATFTEDGTSPEALIKAADDCLYVAKEQGRNVVIRSPQPPKA